MLGVISQADGWLIYLLKKKRKEKKAAKMKKKNQGILFFKKFINIVFILIDF